jgi:hypothetical protein
VTEGVGVDEEEGVPVEVLELVPVIVPDPVPVLVGLFVFDGVRLEKNKIK